VNPQTVAAQPPAVASTLEDLAAEVASLRSRVALLEAQAGIVPELATPEPIAIAPLPVAKVVSELAPADLSARPNDPMGEIKALLNTMFSVVLDSDPDNPDLERVDADFQRFLSLVHDSRKGSPLLNQELFHYKWRPLCKRVLAYLADPADPTSYKITQVTPSIDKIDVRSEIVRLFLRTEKRMPPPLLLRRDSRAGNAFRIDQSSL
jgi:hypothetical protein